MTGRADPWIDVKARALAANVASVARRAGGRPILAVVKNNAYGLGLGTAGPLLDRHAAVAGLAVVTAAEAIALREAGVRKPILLMGYTDEGTAAELVAREVRLAPYLDGAADMLQRLAERFQRPIPVHLYLDTGMSRLGMPFRRAPAWIAELAGRRSIRVEGTFTALTESEFDPEQLRRFADVVRQARAQGAELGRLHVASSHGLFLRPEALFDMVRPGLALYGAHPSEVTGAEADDLTPAFALRTRVVRVERLEPGDGVSYGRRYVAQRPTWIATLPVGHADGYPRSAVNGCEALIGRRTYRVIGAVSASHTIVELGDEPRIGVGDVATLVGDEHPSIHPNEVARRAGMSVYDILMHLNTALPRQVV